MTRNTRRDMIGTVGFIITTLVCTVGSGGCASIPRLPVHPQRYRLEVSLAPSSHRIVGRAVLDLARMGGGTPASSGPVAVELLLHPELEIVNVAASGAKVKSHRSGDALYDDDGKLTAQKHAIVLTEPTDTLTLFIDYRGKLFQDVSAGEKPGEIHNFEMEAHIAEEGVFLGGGHWYPEPLRDEDMEAALTDYTLIVDPVPDMALVAGAQRDPVLSRQTGRLAWRSPYPTSDIVLVGGPHEVHSFEHNGVAISLHLKPEQSGQASGLSEAVSRYLDRYEPLIGPYPADEYSIVDNFFSSGFAFPSFTLLSSAVINMGRRAQTGHGYIDHEMLHCWWGNGIHVDPRDGNWCESLASYAANYYGYVLDGDEENARRKRRNYSHFLSRVKPEDDLPLGTFNRDGGCGRSIAYNKGAAVFHMLARQIGQESFWAAMRRFTAEYMGQHASWEVIRQLCEQESGQSLEGYFDQWIRRGDAPLIAIDHAVYNSANQALTVTLSQGDPTFNLEVPIRVAHEDGVLDMVVALREPVEEITLPISVIPTTVEADPDYHLFRKIPLDRVVPTTAATRYGDAFTTVLPAGAVDERYTSIQSVFESSFEEDERTTVVVGSIEEGALAERCVLILGDAARDPYVSAFLSAVEFPVQWLDEGFEVDGAEYTEPGDAVLCTARHPGVPGGGVTVVYANSVEAVPRAMIVPMYDRSLVIFKDGRRTSYRDYEPRTTVTVDHM
ncbi:MAG: hypothetical protein JSU63_00085 [Phycisphaerales bacterium]|nr:MAG: hypothetical protein JSU63_00085 [Phycisphaerales bacterium]